MATIIYRSARSWADGIIGDATKRRERLVKALQEAVMQGEAIAQQEVDASRPPPVDRGTYRRGFKVERFQNGASLYNDVPYAGVVDEGRRPGRGVSKEGQEAIARWVLRKGLVVKSGPRADREAAAKGIAYLIARKLKAQGHAGAHVMERTIARLTPIVDAAVDKAMSR